MDLINLERYNELFFELLRQSKTLSHLSMSPSNKDFSEGVIFGGKIGGNNGDYNYFFLFFSFNPIVEFETGGSLLSSLGNIFVPIAIATLSMSNLV